MKSRHGAEPRLGDWYLTFTGRQFWPMDPRPEDIDIRDIAHHLSLICRFNGACRRFYSVAQHSCIVSDNLPQPLRREGLLHDAPETYYGDVVRPLKYSLPEYLRAERLGAQAVALRFGVPAVTSREVKVADNRALMTERRDLMAVTPHPWLVTEAQFPPFPEKIIPWSPVKAEAEFITRFFELMP